MPREHDTADPFRFLFQGQRYRDDRMYVLHIAPCVVRELGDDFLETVVHHEEVPAEHSWCLITFRNTERYPATRVDHFDTREEAEPYARSVEPTVPLVSLGGHPPSPAPTYEEFQNWKAANGCRAYDYREVFGGGADPTESFTTRRRAR